MHPTIELINNRKNNLPDDAILAAVVEGGGLRAGFTAGNVAGMEEAGYPARLFNIVVGASGGFYNGAYYVGNCSIEGSRIYSEHVVQHNFTDYKAWLKGRHVVNLTVALDHIMEEEVPIDWQAVIDASQLYGVVTDPHQAGTKVLPPPRSKAELKNNLRASSHIPFLAGRAPKIDGQRCFDGSLTAPLPIDQAIALGATHVLAFSSRPLQNWRTSQPRLERLALRAYDLRYPGIDAAISYGVATAAERTQFLIDARDNPQEPPYIYTVDTPDGIDVHQFEKDTEKLAEIVQIGKLAVQELFPAEVA